MAHMVDKLVHKYPLGSMEKIQGDSVIILIKNDLVINLPLAHAAQKSCEGIFWFLSGCLIEFSIIRFIILDLRWPNRSCQTNKGKIVNFLLSISLYLFCIFLFIIMVLCLFKCFKSNLEGNRIKELKWVKKRQNWKNSMKQEKKGKTGRLFLTEAQCHGTEALAIRQVTKIFLFQLCRHCAI